MENKVKMKKRTDVNILIAFILNSVFSVFEFVGGFFIGSVAITSDAVHDLGDALSIGTSYFLERKSRKKPDDAYTYGYVRFSVLGGFISTIVLIVGSVIVVFNAISRIIDPVLINYNGMIVFAAVGVVINLLSAIVTKDGDSLNQKAVNLHMLEDVLGWVVVLIGAVVIRFTGFYLLDPIMSIAVAIFVFIGAIKNLKNIIEIFLVKTPKDINIDELKAHIIKIDGVKDVHHIHVWTLDGMTNCATMHVVFDGDPHLIKTRVKEELSEHNVSHSTLELEREGEECDSIDCKTGIELKPHIHCHHHH